MSCSAGAAVPGALKSEFSSFHFFSPQKVKYLSTQYFISGHASISPPPPEIDMQLAARASSHSLPRVLIECYLDSLTLCGSEQR